MLFRKHNLLIHAFTYINTLYTQQTQHIIVEQRNELN